MNQFPRVFEKKMNIMSRIKLHSRGLKNHGSALQMFGTEFTIFGQGTTQFHDPK